jgi:hypothetical protein
VGLFGDLGVSQANLIYVLGVTLVAWRCPHMN